MIHRRNAARPASLLSDELCRSHVLRVRITTQKQKVQYREGRAASRACDLLPTNLPIHNQVSHQCAGIAHLETQLTSQNIVLMCPPQNFKCDITWPSNEINAAPHLQNDAKRQNEDPCSNVLAKTSETPANFRRLKRHKCAIRHRSKEHALASRCHKHRCDVAQNIFPRCMSSGSVEHKAFSVFRHTIHLIFSCDTKGITRVIQCAMMNDCASTTVTRTVWSTRQVSPSRPGPMQ